MRPKSENFRKLRFYGALRRRNAGDKRCNFENFVFIAHCDGETQATSDAFPKIYFPKFQKFYTFFFGLFFAIHLQGAHIQVTVHIQLLIFRYLLQFHIQVTIHIQLHLISYLLHPVRIEPTTFYMLQD